MVEDRITDGKRIAQLLASELTGLSVGPLGEVAVVDADPDAAPSPGGTVAYGVAVGGERNGEVRIHPDRAVLSLAVDAETVPEGAERRDGRLVIPVESGADVKQATDAVRAALYGLS
ncbi:MAG: hypothetical protein ABEH56_03205 [Salinirussus sp.]